MNESELYQELGKLTKDRDHWAEQIPYVSSLLVSDSIKIQAKALWLLGEMGLVYPQTAADAVPVIASFCESADPLLRARAATALGRIGRGSFSVIAPYWAGLFRLASDKEAKVRLSFIWASENIATHTPDIYADSMTVLPNCCTMQTIKSGWKRRKCSVSSANADRSSFDLIWNSSGKNRKPTRIV